MSKIDEIRARHERDSRLPFSGRMEQHKDRAYLLERIAELEAERDYWKGYVQFIDSCMEGEELYNEHLRAEKDAIKRLLGEYNEQIVKHETKATLGDDNG